MTIVNLFFSANAKTVKVAVVDTGFDINSTWDKSSLKIKKPIICGTYNTMDESTDVTDSHGHGTHIAGIISKYAQESDYCLIVLKYYDPKVKATDNLKAASVLAHR